MLCGFLKREPKPERVPDNSTGAVEIEGGVPAYTLRQIPKTIGILATNIKLHDHKTFKDLKLISAKFQMFFKVKVNINK